MSIRVLAMKYCSFSACILQTGKSDHEQTFPRGAPCSQIMLLYSRLLIYERGLQYFSKSSTLALFNLKIVVPFNLLYSWLSAAANTVPDPKME